MTTLRVAAWASGAVAVIAVARKSAARTAVNSDRILLLDALWAPLLCWGNRLASSLPEHHGWARGDGGSGGRRRRDEGAAGHAHPSRGADRGGHRGGRGVPGGEPPEGDRMPAVTTALRFLGLSASGGRPGGRRVWQSVVHDRSHAVRPMKRRAIGPSAGHEAQSRRDRSAPARHRGERPPTSATRSAAASSISRPRRPAETWIVGHAAAEASTTVGSGRRVPSGEIPPST